MILRERMRDWLPIGLLTALCACPVANGQEVSGDPPIYECGALALHHVLSLTGQPADLDEVQDRLPPPYPRTRSFAELRDCARGFGLSLTGVVLAKNAQALPPVALMHLNRKPEGHFIVVRRLGHTGKLVQIFDGLHDPYVIDAAQLFAAPEWTGFALIPDPPHQTIRIAGTAAVAMGLACVAIILVPRLRRTPRELAASGPPEN